MVDGRALLDALVAAPAEQRAVGRDEGGADGDAALGEAVAGFLEGDLEEFGVVHRGGGALGGKGFGYHKLGKHGLVVALLSSTIYVRINLPIRQVIGSTVVVAANCP
jgi:hypothetical protein